MSNRTLIEINHDCGPDLASDAFVKALSRYIRSADHESAKALEQFGARVVGMRHHSNNFIIDDSADGFPPMYLTPTGGSHG